MTVEVAPHPVLQVDSEALRDFVEGIEMLGEVEGVVEAVE